MMRKEYMLHFVTPVSVLPVYLEQSIRLLETYLYLRKIWHEVDRYVEERLMNSKLSYMMLLFKKKKKKKV